MQGKIIEYGFQWGPATVERGFCDDQKGWVTLLLKTKKYPHGIQIYVTKTGKVRVHCAKGEWKVGAGKTVPNDRSEPTARLFAQVGSTDGLCPAADK